MQWLQELDACWETVGKLNCMRVPVRARGLRTMSSSVKGVSELGWFGVKEVVVSGVREGIEDQIQRVAM